MSEDIQRERRISCLEIRRIRWWPWTLHRTSGKLMRGIWSKVGRIIIRMMVVILIIFPKIKNVFFRPDFCSFAPPTLLWEYFQRMLKIVSFSLLLQNLAGFCTRTTHFDFKTNENQPKLRKVYSNCEIRKTCPKGGQGDQVKESASHHFECSTSEEDPWLKPLA